MLKFDLLYSATRGFVLCVCVSSSNSGLKWAEQFGLNDWVFLKIDGRDQGDSGRDEDEEEKGRGTGSWADM